MSPDATYMSMAIEAARQGTSTPNPHVGCVVVPQDGTEAFVGVSEPAGGAHAEAVALAMAGDHSRGGTLYVTLEPCNHYGKTPPCTRAIIEAGINRVVIGVRDPNPKAEGGIEFLREHGIQVESGLLASQAALIHKQFLFAMRHKRPMVTVKVGMSLDGRIAMPNGESQWITSKQSRADVMRMREQIGCVLVGRKTAEMDRAKLTVRREGDIPRQPTRVVIDPNGRLSSTLPIFDQASKTVHWKRAGELTELLDYLFAMGETGVLVEGGSTTIAHFLKEGLVDELTLFVAPKILGAGLSWVQDYGLTELSAAEEWCLTQIQNPDLDVDGELPSVNQDIKIVYQSRNLQQFLASYIM